MEVILTKDYATKNKGDTLLVGSLLASRLVRKGIAKKKVEKKKKIVKED